jgi:hypothetical protein
VVRFQTGSNRDRGSELRPAGSGVAVVCGHCQNIPIQPSPRHSKRLDFGCSAGWSTSIPGMFGQATDVDLSDTATAQAGSPTAVSSLWKLINGMHRTLRGGKIDSCILVDAGMPHWESPHKNLPPSWRELV